MMDSTLAQPVIRDTQGRLFIQNDWYPAPLPQNAVFDEMSYPDTAYSFTTFFSQRSKGFSLGYASGNYGHSVFTTGKKGRIHIGRFVVLQCTRIISNKLVTIDDHCMFSWGSVITDSWLDEGSHDLNIRRKMMRYVAGSANRHLEFSDPKPVRVEENAWIGFEAIILPGVTIGRGAVVGCKTVVSADVPPYAVVVGNPARIVKYLSPTDTIEVKRKALRSFHIQPAD